MLAITVCEVTQKSRGLQQLALFSPLGYSRSFSTTTKWTNNGSNVTGNLGPSKQAYRYAAVAQPKQQPLRMTKKNLIFVSSSRRDVKYGHETSVARQHTSAAIDTEIDKAVDSEAYYEELLNSAVPIDMNNDVDNGVAPTAEVKSVAKSTPVVSASVATSPVTVSEASPDAATTTTTTTTTATTDAAPADAAAKTRKKKPAAAPKAAMSSYLFYMQEQFALVRKRAPTASVTDIARSVGKQWVLLDAAAKLPYEEKAKIDSARYYAEKAEYEKSLPPKRAASAYTYFVKQQRDEIVRQNPNMSFADVGRELGKRWHALAPFDAVKQQCENLARADRQRLLAAQQAAKQNEQQQK